MTAIDTADAPALTAPARGEVKEADPQTVREWLERGEAKLIDVREPAEHRAGHISDARLVPLSEFDAAEVCACLNDENCRIVVHCKAGSRARQAAEKIAAEGVAEVWSVRGGIEAWRAAGLPVAGTGRSIIDVQRQTQITVGAVIVGGVVLAAALSTWWLVVPGIAGAGLVMAGATGQCPLAGLIAKMPWNRGGDCAACTVSSP